MVAEHMFNNEMLTCPANSSMIIILACCRLFAKIVVQTTLLPAVLHALLVSPTLAINSFLMINESNQMPTSLTIGIFWGLNCNDSTSSRPPPPAPPPHGPFSKSIKHYRPYMELFRKCMAHTVHIWKVFQNIWRPCRPYVIFPKYTVCTFRPYIKTYAKTNIFDSHAPRHKSRRASVDQI